MELQIEEKKMQEMSRLDVVIKATSDREKEIIKHKVGEMLVAISENDDITRK